MTGSAAGDFAGLATSPNRGSIPRQYPVNKLFHRRHKTI